MGRTRWGAAAAVAAALTLGAGAAVAGATTAAATPGASPAAPSPAAAGTAGAPAGLDRFYRQHIDWHGCQQGAADAEGQALDAAGAHCAQVTVPLDYTRPAGRTITLAVSRLTATDTAHRIGILLFNLGGPGIPAFGRVVDAQQAMGATGARFDVIGMDPRFVGRSTPLDCGWPTTWIPRSAGADRQSFDRVVRIARDLAARCTRTHADVLPYAASTDVARDMDVIRGALGEPRLNYLGYSYGTYFAAAYMQLFGGHAGRMVLDSAIDPTDPGVHVHDHPGPVHEAALRDWAGWAAGHDDQYHLGGTATQVLATIERIYQASARRPLRVGAYDVDDTVFPALLVDPLSDDGDDSNAELATFVQIFARAAAGAPAVPTPELEAALAGILTGVNSALHSAQTAISCADEAVPRDPQWYWRDIQAHRADAPLLGALNRISPCAFWPAPARPIRIGNSVPALIVHADGDIGTRPALNQAMHRALTASRLLTLTGVRTHGVYLFKGSACIDGTVNAYLNTGQLPAGDSTCTT